MSRTGDKLKKLLRAEGFEVTLLTPAQGYWRSSPFADCYRWKALAMHKGVQVALGCWETMTECARNGVTVNPDGAACYTVTAKETRGVPGRD